MRTTMVWVAAIAFVASSAAAQERKTLQIFNDISTQVQRYAYYTIFDDVNASIDNGVVTLTGRVTMPFKKDAIEKRVAKVDGVRRVEDRIQVLPVSRWDDSLRYGMARAIYDSPSFWHYAAMANPPIHIIVENGRVTLTGVVQDNVERMLARSLVMGFDAFSVTNDLKTEAEAKTALEKLS